MGLIRYSFGGDEIVPQGGVVQNPLDDGDFWAGVARCGVAVAIAAAVVPYRPAFADNNDFVAPAVQTAFEEDSQPVRAPGPVPWAQLYLPDPADQAGALSGLPDEDFWALGPRPTQTAPPQAFSDDSDFVTPPAPTLAFEEDAFIPTVPSQPWTSTVFSDTDDLPVAAATPTVDEDCWQPPIPGGLPFWVPAFSDDEVCVPQAIVQGPVDEDFWQPPVPGPSWIPTAFVDTDDLPVAPAATVVDEDFWLPPVPAQPWAPVAFSDTDDLPAPQPIADEDFWVPPPPTAAWRSAPFLATDDIVPQPAFGQPDEDFWTLGPSPVQATLYQRLPYLPDPEEIPAGSLTPPPVAAFFYVVFDMDDDEYYGVI